MSRQTKKSSVKLANRSQIPLPEPPRPFRFPEFDRVKMENGLQIIVAEQNQLPLVSVNLCLNASGLTDPAGKEGLSNLLTETLFEGTETKSSTALANALENLGTDYYTHVDWNTLQVEINTIRKNLEASMDLYSEVILQPNFPDREVERIKKELLVERQRVQDNPSKLSNEMLFRQIYHGHRYSIPLEGTSDSISSSGRDDLADYYKSIFNPNDAAIIFAGDIKTQEAVRLAELHFSDWVKGNTIHVPELHLIESGGIKISLVHKPGAAQAELRMGHPGIDRNDPDYYAITLLNEIFGGYFLSRINMNLREKHGFTYGASSVFSYRRRRGPFLIASSIENESVDKAIEETLKELTLIQSEEVSDDELENAKGYLTGVFPVAFETLDQVAMGLANLVIFRLDDDFYHTFGPRVSDVSKSDILRAAKKHLHPESIEIVVTGDREKIEKNLKKIARVTVYGVEGDILK